MYRGSWKIIIKKKKGKKIRDREREREGGGERDERLDVVYGVKAEDDLA